MIRFIRFLLAGFWLAILIGAAAAQVDDIKASQTVIEAQINAFRSGANEKAFGYASPGLQVIFRDVDNFIRMVKRGYNPIYRARNWAFGRNRTDGNTISHEVLISGPDGGEWVALYTLQRQDDGSWKITGVRLLKSNAKTT